MTSLEAEALLIRHQAALRNLDDYDEDGRWALLAMIVHPSEAVLSASLQVAREIGVSTLAHRMARTFRGEKRRGERVPTPPREWLTV